MRLQLEGVDIGDRAKEQAAKWENHDKDFVSLFYDGHGCFTNLMAGNTVENNKWMDNMREYTQGDRKVGVENTVLDITSTVCRAGTRR